MGGGDAHHGHYPVRGREMKLSKSEIVAAFIPDMAPFEEVYKNLHQFPGLSLQENHAASTAAKHLQSLEGFEVKTKIGGTGLIGILRNGEGKTVLLRADTDALPIEELTGLPYASTVRQIDVEDGIEKPVMHACGHDTHVTCMMAAASTLHAAQAHWKGTLVVLFQPNEERGGGAKAMVDDGLYDETKHACPAPDVVLGQHVFPYPAGSVGTKSGAFGSASDSFEVTVYGRGGHASAPNRSIDPVVIAAYIIVRLQSIVSRETAPNDPVVITVASIHAGLAENVIADFAVMKINVRTMKVETRTQVLAAIKRIAKAECEASGAPQEPLWVATHTLPFTLNDEETTAHLEGPFREHFGAAYTKDIEIVGGSEDFSILATEAPNKAGGKGVPYTYWCFGGTDPVKWDEAVKKGTVDKDIPMNHNAHFAPVIEPTLKTGAEAMSIAALSFLGVQE